MKYEGNNGDPYLDKDTGVLRNLLSIRDQAELDEAESNLSFVQSLKLREQPVKGNFDLAHLQEIHQRLFSDVYDWAGKIRQVEIEKGGVIFARQMVIESAAKQVFGPLSKERHLHGLDADVFSERAGHYLGEINVLHPFREGNGRAQREFIGQLAQAAGHKIDWSGISKEDMIQASLKAYRGDSSGLAGLIRAGMADRSVLLKNTLNLAAAKSFRDDPLEDAIRKNPDLAGSFAKLAAIERKVEVDGLSEQQRRVVMRRVSETLAANIESGLRPEQTIKEDRIQERSIDRDVSER
ncbi:hypothetical protein D8B22_19300 [Verminephrobacter aporrectodeae subsp. tuberculatae]|uniref:Fic/DOC family protein n=1 Tax=Verminephrobacter aporrectodeae TaxID=1110389 RepID=UPI00031BC0A8|nr:Fic/DOC family protein [Verminephrobacter aporrectodeae]MCW8167031.1 hypothetical protein [Verminephrobacter aporrectodeae subsp. tuberculatae]MCW8171196.1 hypothetical protein [Verminephrobacter aporrectodeae subsp. tuberculatae]MCW8208082.1 hypothetical protein [Verminephrobacter aporrectodeae subsp. tuberculatae]